MRCTTCGTENTPDSRFCGGCGAKMQASIPGNQQSPLRQVRFVTPPPGSLPPMPIQPPAPAASAAPAGHAAPTIQPGKLARPPTARADDARVPSPASIAPTPLAPPRPRAARSIEESYVPPKRRWGVVIVMLVVDLALAASGGLLLAKGLDDDDDPAAKPETEKPKPADAVPQKTSEAKPTPPPQPVAATASSSGAGAGSGSGSGSAFVAAGSASGSAVAVADADAGSNTPAARKTPVRKKSKDQPVDPYAAPTNEVAVQVDRAIADLAPQIRRCHGEAGTPAGTVRVSFQVRGDGVVTKIAVAANSTSSERLGTCISNAVATIQLPTHSGGAIDFVRGFDFR